MRYLARLVFVGALIAPFFTFKVSAQCSGDFRDTIAAQGALYHYDMSLSGATVTDCEGLSDGTNSGAAAIAGKIGSALQFVKADGDSVDLGRHAEVEGASQYSWSFVVKFDSATLAGTGNYTIWGKGSGTSNYTSVNVANGRLRVSARVNTAYLDWIIRGLLRADRWYLITVVFDGTQTGNANRLKIFLNGSLRTDAFYSGTIGAALTTATGNAVLGDLPFLATFNFGGIIDESVEFNRVLTPQEISNQFAAFPDEIILENFYSSYQTVQRTHGQNYKVLPIRGQYSGKNGAKVQARITTFGTSTDIIHWTDIDNALALSEFSGTLQVPVGGWYRLHTRLLNASDSVLFTDSTANKFQVGMVYVQAPCQSNCVGLDTVTYTVATDSAAMWHNDDYWTYLRDPVDSAATGGGIDGDVQRGATWWPRFANIMARTHGQRIAVVPAAKASSGMVGGTGSFWGYRDPANPFNVAHLMGNAKARAIAAVPLDSCPEAFVMLQGETDQFEAKTEAEYFTALDSVIYYMRQDLCPETRFQIILVGRRVGSGGSGLPENYTGIRNAQIRLTNGTTNQLAATVLDLPLKSDGIHLTYAAMETIADRFANTEAFNLGLSPFYRGPYIDSARLDSADGQHWTVYLTRSGGTDIIPTTGITGIEARDASLGTWSAADCGRKSAASLVCSASVAVDSMRALYGQNPASNLTDNSTLNLPLAPTVGSMEVREFTGVDDAPLKGKRALYRFYRYGTGRRSGR